MCDCVHLIVSGADVLPFVVSGKTGNAGIDNVEGHSRGDKTLVLTFEVLRSVLVTLPQEEFHWVGCERICFRRALARTVVSSVPVALGCGAFEAVVINDAASQTGSA